MKSIKTSRHTTQYANNNKLILLDAFVQEYRKAAQQILDYLWNNRVKWGSGHVLHIQNNRYDVPQFISTTKLNIQTDLYARALKCCATQVCGIIKASTRKQAKRLYKVHQLLEQGRSPSRSLLNKIRKNKPVKPCIDHIRPELNSICVDLQENNTTFDAFAELHSLGRKYGKIRMPIKYHRHSRKLSRDRKRMSSILIDTDTIDLRWTKTIQNKKTGRTVGADQGLLTTVTLSDSQTTPANNQHGHSLQSITKKLARKKRGSKAFHKAQIHRQNYINWSINQLNLSQIKQINLEEIYNINYRKNTSRYLKHWNNTLIRDKLMDVATEQKVFVRLQPSAYMSQRCSQCGLVHNSNRKGKQYTCSGCGFSEDADLNAALNHEQDLYYLSWGLRRVIREQKLSRGSGFYWHADGLFSSSGEDLTVSLSKNKENI